MTNTSDYDDWRGPHTQDSRYFDANASPDPSRWQAPVFDQFFGDDKLFYTPSPPAFVPPQHAGRAADPNATYHDVTLRYNPRPADSFRHPDNGPAPHPTQGHPGLIQGPTSVSGVSRPASTHLGPQNHMAPHYTAAPPAVYGLSGPPGATHGQRRYLVASNPEPVSTYVSKESSPDDFLTYFDFSAHDSTPATPKDPDRYVKGQAETHAERQGHSFIHGHIHQPNQHQNQHHHLSQENLQQVQNLKKQQDRHTPLNFQGQQNHQHQQNLSQLHPAHQHPAHQHPAALHKKTYSGEYRQGKQRNKPNFIPLDNLDNKFLLKFKEPLASSHLDSSFDFEDQLKIQDPDLEGFNVGDDFGFHQFQNDTTPLMKPPTLIQDDYFDFHDTSLERKSSNSSREMAPGLEAELAPTVAEPDNGPLPFHPPEYLSDRPKLYISHLDIERPKFHRTDSNQSNASVSSVGSNKEALKKKKPGKGSVCVVCDKFISRDLTRHMRIHDEIGRFKCVYPRLTCNHKTGKFNRPYDYKKHLLRSHFEFDNPRGRNHNTLTDMIPLHGECLACGARFSAQEWLDEHVLGGDNRCPGLLRE